MSGNSAAATSSTVASAGDVARTQFQSSGLPSWPIQTYWTGRSPTPGGCPSGLLDDRIDRRLARLSAMTSSTPFSQSAGATARSIECERGIASGSM